MSTRQACSSWRSKGASSPSFLGPYDDEERRVDAAWQKNAEQDRGADGLFLLNVHWDARDVEITTAGNTDGAKLWRNDKEWKLWNDGEPRPKRQASPRPKGRRSS